MNDILFVFLFSSSYLLNQIIFYLLFNFSENLLMFTAVIPTNMMRSLRTSIHTSVINMNPKTQIVKTPTLPLKESVSVRPAPFSTPWMMSPSMLLLNSFHTSTICYKSSKEPASKPKPKKSPALCSILCLAAHQAVQKELLADTVRRYVRTVITELFIAKVQ